MKTINWRPGAVFAGLLLQIVLQTTAHASQVTAIKAGSLVDTTGGKVLQNQLIMVTGGLISSVQPYSPDKVPSDAKLIDLGEATVLPGLIDTHVHLTSNADENGYAGLAISTPRAAINGVVNAENTLMAGFTTVRNLGAGGFTDIALRDAINEGVVPGPRIVAAGPSIGITGGHCDNNLLPVEFNHQSDGVADGPWAVRAKVRKNIKYGADVIKFCATGGVLSKGTQLGAQQYTLEEMKALVDEAHALGRKVAAHAHGNGGIKSAILAGVDSVEHASYIDAAVVKLAKKHGTYLGMDIYVSDYILAEGEANGTLPESLEKEKVVGRIQRENFRRAVKLGAKMTYSTDAGVHPHGGNGKQLAYMVKYGMTPMQAIQAATINAARLIGLEDKVGSVSAGKYADLVAVNGDPIADIKVLENIPLVMKDGKLVKHH